MSLVDIIIGTIVIVPWNLYLIYKMRKDAVNHNSSNQEK